MLLVPVHARNVITHAHLFLYNLFWISLIWMHCIAGISITLGVLPRRARKYNFLICLFIVEKTGSTVRNYRTLRRWSKYICMLTTWYGMQELSSQTGGPNPHPVQWKCRSHNTWTAWKSLFLDSWEEAWNRKKRNQSLLLGLGGRTIRIHCLFWLHHTAYEIFVLQQGQQLLLAVKSRTLTTRPPRNSRICYFLMLYNDYRL